MSSQPPMGDHLAFPEKAFFIQMNLLYEQPPVLKGNFSCVTRVDAHSILLYCTVILIQYMYTYSVPSAKQLCIWYNFVLVWN